MSSEKHVICLKCSPDKKTRKWYDWKTKTFYKVLVDKGLEQLARTSN